MMSVSRETMWNARFLSAFLQTTTRNQYCTSTQKSNIVVDVSRETHQMAKKPCFKSEFGYPVGRGYESSRSANLGRNILNVPESRRSACGSCANVASKLPMILDTGVHRKCGFSLLGFLTPHSFSIVHLPSKPYRTKQILKDIMPSPMQGQA